MRVIYLGTPAFAVPTLEALISDPEFDVVAVVCQPDRPKGRGKQVQAPPVKEVAVKHNIQVFQPEKLSKELEVVEALKGHNPDVLVMVAFGQILKKPVLEMAPFGVINVHASLLPELRGAAPINWSIVNGDKVTGVTTMKTELGVDTGPMLLKEETEIGENTDSIELADKLSKSGAPLLIKTLKGLKDGSVKPIAQDDALATKAPLMNKELGELDWKMTAVQLHNKVRGLKPWPGTYTQFREANLKIIETRLPTEQTFEPSKPGTLTIQKSRILVSCGTDGNERLELLVVQPPNKPKQNSSDWVNGSRIESGDLLCKKEVVQK